MSFSVQSCSSSSSLLDLSKQSFQKVKEKWKIEEIKKKADKIVDCWNTIINCSFYESTTINERNFAPSSLNFFSRDSKDFFSHSPIKKALSFHQILKFCFNLLINGNFKCSNQEISQKNLFLICEEAGKELRQCSNYCIENLAQIKKHYDSKTFTLTPENMNQLTDLNKYIADINEKNKSGEEVLKSLIEEREKSKKISFFFRLLVFVSLVGTVAAKVFLPVNYLTIATASGVIALSLTLLYEKQRGNKEYRKIIKIEEEKSWIITCKSLLNETLKEAEQKKKIF